MLKFKMAAFGCLLSLNALAQFTISGTVRNAQTKEVLAGATIQIEEQKRHAVTDERGRFELNRIPAGDHDLLIKFLGYVELHQTVSVNENVKLDFTLEENAQLTDEVVVFATRANDKTPTTFTNVNGQALQKQNFGCYRQGERPKQN